MRYGAAGPSHASSTASHIRAQIDLGLAFSSSAGAPGCPTRPDSTTAMLSPAPAMHTFCSRSQLRAPPALGAVNVAAHGAAKGHPDAVVEQAVQADQEEGVGVELDEDQRDRELHAAPCPCNIAIGEPELCKLGCIDTAIREGPPLCTGASPMTKWQYGSARGGMEIVMRQGRLTCCHAVAGIQGHLDLAVPRSSRTIRRSRSWGRTIGHCNGRIHSPFGNDAVGTQRFP